MSKLAVYNSKGKEVGAIDLDSDFVKENVNTRVLYYAINNYLASTHRGTHKSKKRDEVSGGGKKPWRQKGTGRARVGSTRSPLWRGGGVVFGPVTRSHAYRLPRQVKRLALVEAIRSKIRDKDCVVFDGLPLETHKTKNMAAVVKSMKLGDSCLMVVDKTDDNIRRAARNIPNLAVKHFTLINALDVLRHAKLAVTQESLHKLLKGKRAVWKGRTKS